MAGIKGMTVTFFFFTKCDSRSILGPQTETGGLTRNGAMSEKSSAEKVQKAESPGKAQ